MTVAKTWASFSGAQFGTGYVFCQAGLICRVALPGHDEPDTAGFARGGFAEEVAGKLAAAFENGNDVSHLPVVYPADAGFFGEVWRACRAIPCGAVASYAELAANTGRPKAFRAAASAMARNPLPLVVPCHRVVRTGGALGNYGGGIEMKRRLLELEGAWT